MIIGLFTAARRYDLVTTPPLEGGLCALQKEGSALCRRGHSSLHSAPVALRPLTR
jgi:hypothetical protein